jgi:hypothetical protein
MVIASSPPDVATTVNPAFSNFLLEQFPDSLFIFHDEDENSRFHHSVLYRTS